MIEPERRLDTVVIAGERFLLERIVNINLLIDQIDDETFGQDERLPYWAELWPSALALSEYVLENRPDFVSKRVLELGSGLGLCGIAATRAGAQVLFSDYEYPALKLVRINFRRNFNRWPAVELLDWRKPEFDGSFDIIIASDVLYERRWLEPVNRILNDYIGQGGFAMIAEPGRTVAKPFFKAMLEQGWRDETHNRIVLLDRKKSKITLHRMQKC